MHNPPPWFKNIITVGDLKNDQEIVESKNKDGVKMSQWDDKFKNHRYTQHSIT